MKIKYLYTLLAVCSLGMISCVKEEGKLEPSGIESGYSVPQGLSNSDNDIVDFYNQYGSYLLYDFTEKDAYWTPSKWQNGTPTSEDEDGEAGFIITMPELEYIAPQLDLLNKTWFSYYSDEFLKEFLPIKILLCSQVQYCDYDWSTWPAQILPSGIAAYYNYDNISVSYASADVETMTVQDTIDFTLGVNRVFIESMIGQEKVEPTEVFSASANYTSASSVYNNTELWALGVLQPYYDASPENDWEQMMTMMICYSEEYLTREVSYVSEWDWEETSWEGIFTAQKDINGKLKERYDMVRQYYIDNYAVDLQSIGNSIYR